MYYYEIFILLRVLDQIFFLINCSCLPLTGFLLVRKVCPEIVILLIGWIINGKYNKLVNLPTLSMVQIEFVLLLMTQILLFICWLHDWPSVFLFKQPVIILSQPVHHWSTRYRFQPSFPCYDVTLMELQLTFVSVFLSYHWLPKLLYHHCYS